MAKEKAKFKKNAFFVRTACDNFNLQARTQRCIYITDKSLLPTEKEQITLLSLPSQEYTLITHITYFFIIYNKEYIVFIWYNVKIWMRIKCRYTE